MTVNQNGNTRILVVDDVVKNIQVIGKILRDKGFLISVAQSGAQALEIVQTHLPDLVLLDILMPEMDGFETCRKLKNKIGFQTIPIIFLSALAETTDKLRGFKAGAVDYVTKPIASEELLARIKFHLEVKSLQENLEDQVKIRTQELLRINKVLRKQEEDYRSVMKAVPDPIIVYDLKGHCVYINPAFTRVFGWTREDLLGKRPGFVVESERNKTKEAIEKTYAQGFLSDFHTQRHTRNGDVLDVSVSCAAYTNTQGENIGIVANLRDITEWKKTQEMVIQNEKMMSLGGLAAGMAHEIKNPLSAVIQNSQVLKNRLFGRMPANIKAAKACNLSLDLMEIYLNERKVGNMLESFWEAGIRINTIIDNMLSFSRKSESKPIPCNLSVLMDKTIALASQDYDLKKNYDFRQICIEREYDPDLPDVPCEESKIQQVFFNILKNGSEAMHESMEKSPCFMIRIRQRQQMVCMEITDNGPGMDTKTQKKIFEPFYTTKGSCAGTGLGLSVSFFIIQKGHNGTLEVASIPGKGTTFTICLPLNPLT